MWFECQSSEYNKFYCEWFAALGAASKAGGA